MRWLSSVRLRPSRGALVVVVVLALLAPLQIARMRGGGEEPAAAAPTPSASPSPSPSPSARPEPSPSRSATKKARSAPAPRAKGASVFKGLGAWVDVYDFDALDVAASVAIMARNGVRTLYIQTGRYNTEHEVAPEVGPWLQAAHGAGMKVVGWYLPAYKNMAKDIRRTVAIASYRHAGHRFDGVGLDIEFKDKVRTPSIWNERVAEHALQVRTALGKDYPIASITPTPLGMAVAPQRWKGFPWKRLASVSDAIMLMSYWSFRNDCPEVREHCAYGYTKGNVERTRTLVGDPDLPIHVIGGVADSISADEVKDFVRAARAAKVYGASLYDHQTTVAAYWPLLAKL